jgi:benzoyl-CoA-dihydrodiol lyase
MSPTSHDYTETKITTFESHPSRYRHWRLEVSGDIATLKMDIQERDEGQAEDEGYIRKLNSYDIFVDIELNDAINRLYFEHPEVRCLVVTSGKDRVFCAGANIPMLASSPHAFKVNFCKYTNETRLALEDISLTGGPKTLAALNGVASGGGYELALACDEITLVDDRSSAVSLPEVPLLGVLPGTGGLTRVVDKRKVRRDLADYFSSLAEGVRGKRAVDWRLVDSTHKLSVFPQQVAARARALADSVAPVVEGEGRGVSWGPVAVEVSESGDRAYPSFAAPRVVLRLNTSRRAATLTVHAPADGGPTTAAEIEALGVEWWPVATFRALEDALLHLRFNHLDIGTLSFMTRGDQGALLAVDAQLEAHAGSWFVSRARHYIKRVLKRLDVSSMTLLAIVDEGSAFAGTLFELVAMADRSFMLDDPKAGVEVRLSPMNFGPFPMGNGLTRLGCRFLGEPSTHEAARGRVGEALSTEEARELGLVTFTPDDIDWEDEVRLALEERSGFSPDALTGMESNLRFAGPETMETKIFGRLSAWQNWIFQRPNAVGPEGALKAFGSPRRPVFDWDRT